MPNPVIPALNHSPKFAGPAPPTAYIAVCAGKTARMALMPAGPITEHGKIFKPSAPALRAPKHSDGVRTPGHEASFNALVAATTSASKLGETMIRPPALATSRTSCAVRTVPAPIVARDPNVFAKAAIVLNGLGEFKGISIVVRPASSRASQIGSASSGPTPRRMAIMLRVMKTPSQSADKLISAQSGSRGVHR